MSCKGLKGSAYSKCMAEYTKSSKDSFKGFSKSKDTVVSQIIKKKNFKGMVPQWSGNSGNGSTRQSMSIVHGSQDWKSSYLFKKKDKETNNYKLKK